MSALPIHVPDDVTRGDDVARALLTLADLFVDGFAPLPAGPVEVTFAVSALVEVEDFATVHDLVTTEHPVAAARGPEQIQTTAVLPLGGTHDEPLVVVHVTHTTGGAR